MLQGKNATKNLYFIRIYKANTRCCGYVFVVFFITIMFHISFIKCFTNLATISWVVMFHVKHYVV